MVGAVSEGWVGLEHIYHTHLVLWGLLGIRWETEIGKFHIFFFKRGMY